MPNETLLPCLDFASSRCSLTILLIGIPVSFDVFFNHWKISSVRRMFTPWLITQSSTNGARSLFPNIRDRRRIAIPFGKGFQSEVVFNRAQHVVMRVMAIQHFGILLAGFLHHVSEEQGVDAIVRIVV